MVRYHDLLEAAFHVHQECLLDFDYPRARALFQRYREWLDCHMRHEETWLLPVFARIGEIKRWPARLYTGEHEKMNGFLDRIAVLLDRLCEQEPPAKAALLQLLDVETSYKHLVEHHHEREVQAFFPILDQVTNDEEKVTWLERIREDWARLPPLH